MRHLLVIVFFMLFVCSSLAVAEDSGFSLVSEVKKETLRLSDEALDVVKTPIDTENGGFLKTVAVGGAVGLTYVFDSDIRKKVLDHKGKALDKATDAGSLLGNPFLHLGVAGAVYGGGVLADSPKWRETGEMLGEAAILSDVATFILKEAVGRGRPFKAGEKDSFRPLQFKTDFDSLPSMHTSSSFAMASVMAATSESIAAKLLYYSAASFVGFSRIYQDKHWASDVVLGAAVGELCGRVVTSYHASGRKVVLAPLVSRDAAGLALLGSF